MVNRLNLILAAATLVLAGITAHYVRAVIMQRAQNAGVLAAAASSPADRETRAGRQTSGIATSTAVLPASTENSIPSDGNRFDPVNVALNRYRLNELRDSRGRAQKKKELAVLFQVGLAPAATSIGMSYDDLQLFAQARAEQALEWQRRRMECQLDPGCDVAALTKAYQATSKQQQADWLGPEKAARLKAFNDSFYERAEVQELQQRLSIPEDLAARLELTLSDEARKFDADAQLYGLEIHKVNGAGVLQLRSTYQRDAPGDIQQREESAKRYYGLLYRRASALLNATQLKEFKAIQDRNLAEYVEWMRDDVIATRARKAASP